MSRDKDVSKGPNGGRSNPVKMTGDDTFGGYLVLYGGPDAKDLHGEYFAPDTDYGLEYYSDRPVLYQHGYDPVLKGVKVGEIVKLTATDKGLWADAQITMRNEYLDDVKELIGGGYLGWSSGALPSSVEVAADGKIKRWVIVEGSLTPTPADPRNVIPIQKFVSKLSGDNALGAVPEAAISGGAAADEPITADNSIVNDESTLKGDNMSENEKNTVANEAPARDENAVAAALKGVTAALKGMGERLDALENAPATKDAGYAVGHVKRATGRGFADEPVKAFAYWVKTGDAGAAKAAMQENTDSEGGYLVPEELLGQVIAKRDEQSLVRMIPGIARFTSSHRVLDIPVENSDSAAFGLTAEEGAFSQAEPTFALASVTNYKFTRKLVMSDELEADEAAGLMGYMAGRIAREQAKTENYYFVNGTGSSQPEGILAGGTNGTTLAATGGFSASEVPEMVGMLSEPYLNGAVWVMRFATENIIRAIQGNEFLFAPTPAGTPGDMSLWGYPLYRTDQMPAVAAAAKAVAFLNPEYFAFVERSGLTVQRDPYSAADNGQVVLRYQYRFGMKVLQAAAIQYADMAAT